MDSDTTDSGMDDGALPSRTHGADHIDTSTAGERQQFQVDHGRVGGWVQPRALGEYRAL